MIEKYRDDEPKRQYLSALMSAIEYSVRGKYRGWVYFIRTKGADFVKIGYTIGGLYKCGRINEMQTGCPFELFVEGGMPGAMQHERKLHKLLVGYSVRGEWFRWCEDVESVLMAGYEDDINTAIQKAEGLHLTSSANCGQ
jgi:hypothetical protein